MKKIHTKNQDKDSGQKLYYIRDTQESYRVINHWSMSGLLDSNDEHKWRSFSIVDIAWIKTIAALREVDVPIKKIAVIKKQLFKGGSSTSTSFSIFENTVARYLESRESFYLILNKTGDVTLTEEQELYQNLKNSTSRSLVLVSLEEAWHPLLNDLDKK